MQADFSLAQCNRVNASNKLIPSKLRYSETTESALNNSFYSANEVTPPTA
jgi:hypothetical protein